MNNSFRRRPFNIDKLLITTPIELWGFTEPDKSVSFVFSLRDRMCYLIEGLRAGYRR